YTESINLDSFEQRIEQSIQTALDNALDGVEITKEQQKELETLIAKQANAQVEQGVNEALGNATVIIDDTLDEYETVLLDTVDELTITLQSDIELALNEP